MKSEIRKRSRKKERKANTLSGTFSYPLMRIRGASLHVSRWTETNYSVVSAENRLTIESGVESVSILVEVAGGQRNQITQRALTWCGACEVWPKTGTPSVVWKRGKLFPRSYICIRVHTNTKNHTQLAHPLPYFRFDATFTPLVVRSIYRSFLFVYLIFR